MNNMKDFNLDLTSQISSAPDLKVVHKKSGKLDVFFPFSEVPIEMTTQYFQKHINQDDFRIDILNDRDRPIAG